MAAPSSQYHVGSSTVSVVPLQRAADSHTIEWMRSWWLLLACACGGDGSKAIDAAIGDASPDACAASHTIFLNRGGGTYTVGPDDATMNKSSAIGQTRTLPPPTTVDADWTAVMTCVTSKLSTFPITVTDQDPGTAQHVEVVVLDSGNQNGVPGLTAGAPSTPCAGGFGTAAKNTIAFAVWQGTNANRCWDLSMAIGYTLGLDNVLPCEDLMSQNPSCSIPGKAFTNVDQPCGDTAARNCRCGGTTQNAAQRIAANVGTCP